MSLPAKQEVIKIHYLCSLMRLLLIPGNFPTCFQEFFLSIPGNVQNGIPDFPKKKKIPCDSTAIEHRLVVVPRGCARG